MPLQRRLPKFGFRNPFRVEYRVMNLSDLQNIVERFSLDEITPELLESMKIIKRGERVKILGKGDLTKKVNVTAHAFSAAAKSAIEAAEGTATIL